jgi:photosystem II stability/assembly factor-like uncharacterized protein
MRRRHDPLGLIVAADDGLYHVEPGGDGDRVVPDHRFTHVEYYDGLGAAAGDEGIWVFGGRRWEQAWEGDVRSVSVTPGGAIFAGTGDGGLLRSEDRGETWAEIEGARNLLKHNNFAGAQGERRAIFVSVVEVNEGLIIGVAGGGAWHTRDGGKSWLRRSDGLDPKLHRFWAHPEHADRLFATADSGIFRSEDEGHTWVQSIGGLDRSWGGTIAIMPGAPDALIVTAAREAPGRDGAVFRSANGGVTWSRLMLDDEDEWERVPVVVRPWDWEDVAFVAAGDGIWASHDRGRTWVGLGHGYPVANALSASL